MLGNREKSTVLGIGLMLMLLLVGCGDDDTSASADPTPVELTQPTVNSSQQPTPTAFPTTAPTNPGSDDASPEIEAEPTEEPFLTGPPPNVVTSNDSPDPDPAEDPAPTAAPDTPIAPEPTTAPEATTPPQTTSFDYDYSAANLELILLEDAALVDAVDAASEAARSQALSYFISARLVRLELSPATANQDSVAEGTDGPARWQDFQRQPGTPPYAATDSGLSLANPQGIDQAVGFQAYVAQQRWRYSGASLIETLTLLGVPNLDEKLELGITPAELAIDVLPMSQGAANAVIADARAIYDPDGSLAALAATWAAGA